MTEVARQVWQERLNFLLIEEAKCADPAQKFKIQQDIKEAQEKLKELSAEESESRPRQADSDAVPSCIGAMVLNKKKLIVILIL